ncbi:(2Fe-2S)-binding protein [Thermasporomyces composti]|jgi:carbon-monoxide dehydrogenase small subunit|uniref:Carbon-monoxide dehydrogenase small subunit n=1 Tax=Thermasporomyces composti TaxID=696763 RepID=A0A3D9VG21_THECX|nr:(2Fe-2S)-binding protein [Thermasporomyces composti]REF36251.1 carbon-monoxide dehydrogenase small subunit [Thermasporomyces composti]
MAVLNLTVDGVRYDDYIEERTLLVHLLRDRLGKVSTRVGCDTNECGACTVLVDGRAVRSCSMLALQADGRTVTTVDSASHAVDGPVPHQTPSHQAVLEALAQTFRRHRATPCGFCTPGMLLSAVDLLSECPVPTEDEVRDALAGTRCRCGDEHTVVRAVLSAVTELRGLTPAERSRGTTSRDAPPPDPNQGESATDSAATARTDHTLAGHRGAAS